MLRKALATQPMPQVFPIAEAAPGGDIELLEQRGLLLALAALFLPMFLVACTCMAVCHCLP